MYKALGKENKNSYKQHLSEWNISIETYKNTRFFPYRVIKRSLHYMCDWGKITYVFINYMLWCTYSYILFFHFYFLRNCIKGACSYFLLKDSSKNGFCQRETGCKHQLFVFPLHYFFNKNLHNLNLWREHWWVRWNINFPTRRRENSPRDFHELVI